MVSYTDELLDFMYIDRPKVASLLAQFLSDGLVEEQTVETHKERNAITGAKASVGGIASFLGLSAEHGRSSAEGTTETVAKNPEWAQAKALVQYVSDVSAQSDDDGAKVGSIKILVGQLTIYDLKPFQTIADNSRLMEAIKAVVKRVPNQFSKAISAIDAQLDELESARSSRKSDANLPSKIKKLRSDKEAAVEHYGEYVNLAVEGIGQFIRNAPFSTVATLSCSIGNFWFSLKETSLLHDQGDTLLKFGADLDGEWSVACIIDGEKARMSAREFPSFDASSNQNVGYYLANVFAQFSGLIVGRPEGHRSLLPLVVFRSLGTILK